MVAIQKVTRTHRSCDVLEHERDEFGVDLFGGEAADEALVGADEVTVKSPLSDG